MQSNYQIQPHHYVPAQVNLAIPTPRNLEKDVTLDEYIAIYKSVIRKYQRRERHGKVLTVDPE